MFFSIIGMQLNMNLLFTLASVVVVVVVGNFELLSSCWQILPKRVVEIRLKSFQHVVCLSKKPVNSDDCRWADSSVFWNVLIVIVFFATYFNLQSFERSRAVSPATSRLGVVWVLSQQPVVVDLSLRTAEKKREENYFPKILFLFLFFFVIFWLKF